VELVDSLDLGDVTPVKVFRPCQEEYSMMKTHTQRAFVCLMIPLIHVTAFAVIILLFTALKFPTDHSGIESVFYLVDMLLMCVIALLMLTFPVVQLGSGIRSIMHQVRALRNQESKVKNGIMMAVSIMYFVAVILYCYHFGIGWLW
jgi:hypothetical protein